MVKGILIAALLVLAVSGICEIIHLIRLSLVSDGKKNTNYALVFLRNGRALCQLRYMYEQFLWQGNAYADTIIGIDYDLCDDERKLCYEYSRKKNIIIVIPEMLGGVLDTLYNNEEN